MSTHLHLALLICLTLFSTIPLRAQPIIADEDIVNASQALRGLLYEREELRADLEEMRNEARQLELRIKSLNKLVDLQKTLDQLWSQIEEAEERGEQHLVAQLAARADRLETQIEQRRELAEIDGELQELEALLEELREEERREDAETVAKLVRSLQSRRKIVEQLHDAPLDDPDDSPAALEQRSEQLNDDIKTLRELVELRRELFAAQEEDEDEQVEQLQGKIRDVQRQLDGKPAPGSQARAPIDPSRLPIPVTDEALAAVADADLDRDAMPLLKTYCFDCHGSDTQSGELDMERLLAERPIVKNRDHWINILEQAKNRVMPPAEDAQPSESERTRMVLVLHNTLYNFDYSQIDDPGFEPVRRLTHDEYDNTVRDLLDVDLRPASKFPLDLVGASGFDNSANSLFVQPLLMERYVGAAEEAASSARSVGQKDGRLLRERMFGAGAAPRDAEAADVESLLARWLLRAYRRPAAPQELDRAIRQFQHARAEQLDEEAALAVVVQATLISPNFLLKQEQQRDAAQPFRVDDWELASRLSYFLWASMPDDELFDLAQQGRLRDDTVFAAQVARMIDDPKSKTLGTIFAAQWLGSRHLGVRVRMDPIDNPWCTESLMAAMRDETSLFFHSLVRENQPLARLIDADYTFLNDELAKHYRIAGVAGAEMQRVSLKTNRRGGILGHGSLLAVTSFPYRTSPVVRGKWILADVLGTPPPPPPPNVSELPDDIAENERLTFRQKLELHRRAPNCYACHSQIDPLGLSLENYDWFGRWRGKTGRRQADVRGQLPDGTEFVGLPGLKQVIVEQRLDDLTRQLSSKMLSYALGRQLEYYDEPAVRKITAAVEQDGHRLRTLIREVALSYPFQYKKSRSEEEGE